MKIQEQWLNGKDKIINVQNNIICSKRRNGKSETINLITVYAKYINKIVEEGGVITRNEKKDELIVDAITHKMIVSEATEEELTYLEETYEAVGAFLSEPSVSSEALEVEYDQLLKVY